MESNYNRDPDVESSGDEKGKHNATGAPLTEAKSASQVPWTLTRVVAVVSLCLVYVGAQSILYMTGGTLNYIGASIGTKYPNWLLTANTLAVTAICPFVGYISDLLGRRYVTIFGSLLLIVASVVQATSKSLGSSVTAQALGGIGAGICELTALAGVAEITPVRYRGVTLSVVTFSILPFIPYILYIEELHAHSTWRWALGIAAIWNGIGTIGIILCYHPPPRHMVDDLSRMDILKRIDWGGAFLSISGVTLFLVGLQYGGYQAPWTSATTLAPLIIGILLIVAFCVYEAFIPKFPMVPAAIFKGQRVVLMSYIIVFIAGMEFYSILGFFPLMLQNVWPASPEQTGLRGFWYPLAILIGACLVSAGITYSRGRVAWMFVTCSVLMTAFCGSLASATPFNMPRSVAFATLGSLGIGGVIVPCLTVALYCCPDAYIGTTAALSLAVRFLGGSVGTTIYYNIFNTSFMTNVPKLIAPAVVAAGLPVDSVEAFIGALFTDPTSALTIPGVTMEILQVGGLQARWAFTESLKGVWYASIAFGAVSIVASCFLPNIKRFMTNRVAVDIH
ncbi:putative major facilitator superfamily transporter [Pseudovirgaria hyperparasitica]|uniref:Putative major facilitator superfamily transporter n=1 Tax=Pseudovirgaria hyperparasitica TaxID=470096 RepID=A0A6A6W5L5_9PEZI|nr:putative major facilitator superfamily transporter [Pseudovirgaria hyperparasitica]KAF2757893.1 putative major facilitator superfamily transporter [Pseudovirgaria hyperparasitica]